MDERNPKKVEEIIVPSPVSGDSVVLRSVLRSGNAVNAPPAAPRERVVMFVTASDRDGSVYEYGSNVDEQELLEEGMYERLESSHKQLMAGKKTKHDLRRLTKKQKKFYDRQNELLDKYDEDHKALVVPGWEERRRRGGSDDRSSVTSAETRMASSERNSWTTKLKMLSAVNFSFMTNVLLLGLKLVAAIMSGSMSVIASAMDSVLDILSGFILYLTSLVMRHKNPTKYPVGKERMEPLGTLVFSCIMSMAALQLVVESVQILIGSPRIPNVSLFPLLILGFTILSKSCLFVYCLVIARQLRKLNAEGLTSVRALQRDHRNDVLTNTFGAAMAVLGSRVESLWYLDPVGAIVLSLYIVQVWVRTAYEQIQNITGKAADRFFVQRVTYLATMHDHRILSIEMVRAFHLGNSLFCELHVVLPPDMPLRDAHDIGESLERKIESLDEVEMAFVHMDCDVGHEDLEHIKVAEASGVAKLRANARSRLSTDRPSASPMTPVDSIDFPELPSPRALTLGDSWVKVPE